MQKRRLKGWVDDEGLTPLIGPDGLLATLIDRAGWGLRVAGAASRLVDGRRLADLDVEVPEDEEIDLPVCRGLSVVAPPAGTQRLRIRILSRPGRDDGTAATTTAVLGGDLSIVLSRLGLIPVGRIAEETPAAGRPARLRPGAGAVLGLRRPFAASLGASLLVLDGVRGGLRATPEIDLRGQIFRLGDAGLLMGFDGLALSCEGSTPRVELRGGRIWRPAT